MELEAETPEVRNWILKDMLGAGVPLCYLEGFSVKEEKVTALFERRKSDKDPSSCSTGEVASFLTKNESEREWKSKCRLAEILGVPLYLVIWRDAEETFRICSVSCSNSSLSVSLVTDVSNCKGLADWLAPVKGIHVSKKFEEFGRLSIIDKCLRDHGMPWPGDLDGFVMRANSPSVLIEFARTRVKSVSQHNLNDYFPQDINRWTPLEIARKCLKVPFLIVTWRSIETKVKVQELIEFNALSSPPLKMRNVEILSSDQVVEKLKGFC